MVNKIFVLADDDGVLIARTFPNRRIVGRVKSQIENVRSLMALTGSPSRQRGRELRVNEEVHAGCKTAWSDWRAA